MTLRTSGNKAALGVGVGIVTLSSLANAAMPEKDYIAALKLAEEKVLQDRQASARSTALSSGMIKLLYGRYYKPGDQWDVAVALLNGNQMSLPPSGKSYKKWADGVSTPLVSGIFHYQVEEVNLGPLPEITLRISQLEKPKLGKLDPNVKSIVIKMTEGIYQTEKHYQLKSSITPVRVFSDSVRSRLSILELFPLDVPNLTTSLKKTVAKAPELPPSMQALLNQMAGDNSNRNSNWDLSQSSWFEQDDFFGRPVQVLWQQGDPWPAYMKTSSGIAVLLPKGSV